MEGRREMEVGRAGGVGRREGGKKGWRVEGMEGGREIVRLPESSNGRHTGRRQAAVRSEHTARSVTDTHAHTHAHAYTPAQRAEQASTITNENGFALLEHQRFSL